MDEVPEAKLRQLITALKKTSKVLLTCFQCKTYIYSGPIFKPSNFPYAQESGCESEGIEDQEYDAEEPDAKKLCEMTSNHR